jgi:hypothetical protein
MDIRLCVIGARQTRTFIFALDEWKRFVHAFPGIRALGTGGTMVEHGGLDIRPLEILYRIVTDSHDVDMGSIRQNIIVQYKLSETELDIEFKSETGLEAWLNRLQATPLARSRIDLVTLPVMNFFNAVSGRFFNAIADLDSHEVGNADNLTVKDYKKASVAAYHPPIMRLLVKMEATGWTSSALGALLRTTLCRPITGSDDRFDRHESPHMTYGVYAAFLTALCSFRHVDLLRTVRESVDFIWWTRLPNRVFGDGPNTCDLTSLLIKWTTGLKCNATRDVGWQLKMKYIALFTLHRDLALP